MYKHVDWMIDNPDVRVRVHPEEHNIPAFAVLSIDDVTFFANHLMHTLDAQLNEFERVGRLILEGVRQVRPQIPRSAA